MHKADTGNWVLEQKKLYSIIIIYNREESLSSEQGAEQAEPEDDVEGGGEK